MIDEELESIIKLIQDQKKYVASTDMDFGSDASKIRNAEMLKSMRSRTLRRQKALRDALRKIKYGTDKPRVEIEPRSLNCLISMGQVIPILI